VKPATYQRVCRVALWALVAIVITGAAVRLTGSGLGCSDWPTCEEGKLIAPMEFHAMVEFVNRTITGVVSLAVIVAVAGSLLRRPRRADLTRWSLALVAGVIAQIIIGGIVVLSELDYSAVAVHFLVSMWLVAAAIVLVERAGRPDDEPPRRWQPWGGWTIALATAVLVSGAVVTSAGPHAGDPEVERLPVDLGVTVRTHSVLVWTFLVVVAALAWSERNGPARVPFTQLLVAITIQGGIGYLQYFTGVPAMVVLLHVAMATLVWAMTVRTVLRTAAPVEVTEPAPLAMAGEALR
jgi:cytochrome c oxidase assembly protein subunit 15